MADELLKEGVFATPIDLGTTLADGARGAGDYDNSGNLHPWCNPVLIVQWDAGPPTKGDLVGELYCMPGDGEATELFPEGGDGSVGSDDTPQQVFFVGAFESVNPSLTVNERIALPRIKLYFAKNRFVFLNTSTFLMDAGWQIDLKTFLRQI